MPSLFVEVAEGVDVTRFEEATETLARLRLEQGVVLPVFRAEEVDVLGNYIEVATDDDGFAPCAS
jgi:hypothetical protein